MDQKLNGEARKKEKLDLLPNLNDKEFWLDADNEEIKLGEPLTCERKEHEFIYGKKANEARCIKCPVGYILPIGSEIKEGHIYILGQFVI